MESGYTLAKYGSYFLIPPTVGRARPIVTKAAFRYFVCEDLIERLPYGDPREPIKYRLKATPTPTPNPPTQ
jgi:hypothetical protein